MGLISMAKKQRPVSTDDVPIISLEQFQKLMRNKPSFIYGKVQIPIGIDEVKEITGLFRSNRSAPPGAWASRPPKLRPRWPRSQDKEGGAERLHPAQPSITG